MNTRFTTRTKSKRRQAVQLGDADVTRALADPAAVPDDTAAAQPPPPVTRWSPASPGTTNPQQQKVLMDRLSLGLATLPPGIPADRVAALRQVLQEAADAEARGVRHPGLAAAVADVEVLTIAGTTNAGAALGRQMSSITTGLLVGGQPLPDLDKEGVSTLSKLVPRNGGAFAVVLAYLRAYGDWNFKDTAELGKVIDQIADEQNRRFDASPKLPVTTPIQWIAQQIVDDFAIQETVGRLMGAETTQVAPGHVRELSKFLDANPHFVPNIAQRGVKWVFFSHYPYVAANGGAAYVEAQVGNKTTKTIHVGNLNNIPPSGFVRLLVHETGHASFQKDLLGKNLPPEWENGTVFADLRRRQALLQLTRQTPVTGDDGLPRDPTDPVAEAARLERALADLAPMPVWNEMSEDARAYYRAWLVLREDGGTYFLNLDMGDRYRPFERQVYQHNSFPEFIAETFMQSAVGDLDEHLADLRTRQGVPEQVLDAWAAVKDVLDRRAVRIYKAPPAPRPPAADWKPAGGREVAARRAQAADQPADV